MCGIAVVLSGCSVKPMEPPRAEAKEQPANGLKSDLDPAPTASSKQIGEQTNSDILRMGCQTIQQQLQRRGPDSTGREQVVLGSAAKLQLQGSVLQLRGTIPAKNPVKDVLGNCLVFNGEIFGGVPVPAGFNDTQSLLLALADGSVIDVMNAVRGPWAIVYWQHSTRTLWFGKDVLGRRSLLVHYPTSHTDSFYLSSTAADLMPEPARSSVEGSSMNFPAHAHGASNAWQELEPGLHSLHIAMQWSSDTHLLCTDIQHYKWHDPQLLSIKSLQRPSHLIDPLGQSLPASNVTASDTTEAGTGIASRIGSSSATGGTIAAAPVCAEAARQGKAAVPGCLETNLLHLQALAGSQLALQNRSLQEEQFVRAVQLMLTALRQSVATRCRCIDDHSQHQPTQPHQAAENTLADGLLRLPLQQPQHVQQQQHHSCEQQHCTEQEHDSQQQHHKEQQQAGQQQDGLQQKDHNEQGTGKQQQSDTELADVAQRDRQPYHGTASTEQSGGAQWEASAGQARPALGLPVNLPQAGMQQSRMLQAALEHSTSRLVEICQQGSQEQQAQLEPAPVLILFSGGVDSTLIAALAHETLPRGVPVDLASVCFNQGQSADRLAAWDAVQELAEFAPDREWRLIEVDTSLAEVDQHRDCILGLLHPSATIMDVNIGAALWMAAQAEGCVTVIKGPLADKPSTQPNHTASAQQPLAEPPQQIPAGLPQLRSANEPSEASSASLDCDSAAFPQHSSITSPHQPSVSSPWRPTPDTPASDAGDSSSTYRANASPTPQGLDKQAVPLSCEDERSAEQAGTSGQGVASAGQEQAQGQGRRVGQDRQQQQRQQKAERHKAQRESKMKRYQSKVQGQKEQPWQKQRQQHAEGQEEAQEQGQGQRASQQRYKSRARVVLLGHGADEQHAGYGRHRTSFRNQGWQGLQQELALDMLRLWQRNLGRDDRLVADTSREARHPFLDEDYIDTVLSLPLWLIADLRLQPGIGDKRLLRAALKQLGLPNAAARVKRAIQFGTGIGKLSNIRAFGSNRAANTRNAGSLSLDLLAAK